MFLLLVLVSCSYFCRLLAARYVLDYITPESCVPGRYFDTAALTCAKCGSDRGQEELQIASEDGLSCRCRPLHKLTSLQSSTKISCEQCPPRQVTSWNGRACVACGEEIPFTAVTNTCSSCTNGRLEEAVGNDGSKQLICIKCSGDTWPNADYTKCVPCPADFLTANNGTCSCPSDKYMLSGGTCIPREILPPNADMAHLIKYMGGTLVSKLYQRHFQAALYNCKVHSNETACQLLANLCVLQLYDLETDGNACQHYLKLGDSSSPSQSKERPQGAPWLFYLDDDPSTVTYRADVPNQFTIKPWKNTSYLHFVAGKFTVHGRLLGIEELDIQDIMLCNAGLQNEDVLRFGTAFSHKCELNVRHLWDNSRTTFYDLYLQSDGEWQKIYPTPVKITNIEHKSKQVNAGNDASDWRLVRRFFMVDVDAGIEEDSSANDNSSAKFLRYAEDINIHITLYNKLKPGSIYPPLITVRYAEVSRDAYDRNSKVSASFSITYSANQSQAFQDISVAIGVLSGLAILWACIQAWNWSRRSRKSTITIMALLKLLIFTCAALSNVFLIVILCASLNWLIMYKQQDVVHIFLPTPAQERTINTYIIFAFLMKALHLFHNIGVQSSVDIFFLDWERPHAPPKPRHHGGLRLMRAARKEASKIGGDDSSQLGAGDLGDSAARSTGEDAPAVTIWRSYFAANEWCELQSYRRVSLPLQLLGVLFFLKVIGMEYNTLATPESYYSRGLENINIPFSGTCRFALAAALHLLLAAVQVLIHKVIYERFFEDKLQHFVDLCSVSNISLFIFVQPRFGYYIHGRSAQGQADVSMKEMHELLRREEEDLCGHRGLLPDTDQQTFRMILPLALYEQYLRMRKPLSTYAQAPDRMQIAGGHLSRADIETVVNTYSLVTKFLSAFIDHSIKDLDYTVKDRTWIEKLLGIEIQDGAGRAVFYNDNGHSFDAVIYHGHELTLVLFDLLLFCVIDLGSNDFVLAAVLTLMIDKILESLRMYMGRRNLVKKALVDERFLW